jgi:hypothetical protein
MGKPRFGRSSGGDIIELALAQSVDKITREDDPLALPPVQPLLDKMIDPAFNVFVERLWRSNTRKPFQVVPLRAYISLRHRQVQR